eukprot:TRINITY_DN481_c0_g1_i1.p1 TRINITY_DN481_c0_g1~~TRINITY_DN481_c0_g1_i1.p1  ORF type:complete len:544 (-),score=95.59 TRINITY_DN481_c0_g1_i1:60-1691(-)
MSSSTSSIRMKPFTIWNGFQAAIHVTLFICALVQIIIMTNEFSHYTLQNRSSFISQFTPNSSCDTLNGCLYNIQHALSMAKTYPQQAPNAFILHGIKHHPIKLTLLKRTNSTEDITHHKTIVYSLKAGEFGPFNQTSDKLRDLFHTLDRIIIDFSYFNLRFGDVFGVISLRWNLRIKYLFGDGSGHVWITLELDKTIKNIPSTNIFWWLNLVILIVSAGLFATSIMFAFNDHKDMNAFAKEYNHLAKVHYFFNDEGKSFYRDYRPWKDISSWTKMGFVDFWNYLDMTAALLFFTSSVMGFFVLNATQSTLVYRTVIGIAQFLNNLNAIRYLQYIESFYLLSLTIKYSFPLVTRFLVPVCVIFCSFLLLGVILLFSSNTSFQTVSATTSLLISVGLGDSILQVLNDVAASNLVIEAISRPYILLYILFFLTIILKILIFIIQDAYDSAKIKTFEAKDKHKHIEDVKDLFELLHVTKRSQPEVRLNMEEDEDVALFEKKIETLFTKSQSQLESQIEKKMQRIKHLKKKYKQLLVSNLISAANPDS